VIVRTIDVPVIYLPFRNARWICADGEMQSSAAWFGLMRRKCDGEQAERTKEGKGSGATFLCVFV
jgi:hypothetical protein